MPPILFFDGVCNLCNRFIQFVIKNDSNKLFLFAPIQSDAFKQIEQKLLENHKAVPDSVILYYNDRLYTKSDAVLKMMPLLNGKWIIARLGYIFPRFIRNAVYDWVAARRYKFFGKKDECMIPTPELQSRFLK